VDIPSADKRPCVPAVDGLGRVECAERIVIAASQARLTTGKQVKNLLPLGPGPILKLLLSLLEQAQ
jgi:hypothetical protein